MSSEMKTEERLEEMVKGVEELIHETVKRFQRER